MAPELVDPSAGHGLEVDWWALGVLLYEMLVGLPPFSSDSVFTVYRNILAGRVTWPAGQGSAAARHLVSCLLTRSPAARLGGSGAGLLTEHKGSNINIIDD